jgi:hypothetical protein
MIKTISAKEQGLYNLYVQSTLGFSDSTNEIYCQSVTLFNDGNRWIIQSLVPAIHVATFVDGPIQQMGTIPLALLGEPAFSNYWDFKEIRIEFERQCCNKRIVWCGRTN